jgi:DNA-binding response OmpR family regulator
MSERRTLRLLILDDEPSFGIILGRIAERSGWTARSATDVASFQAQFNAERPDAIVLDLNLGATDGRMQLGFLRDAGFDGGIVLMSGSDADALAAAREIGRSLGLAIVGLIAKPTENEAIRGRLAVLADYCAGRPVNFA